MNIPCGPFASRTRVNHLGAWMGSLCSQSDPLHTDVTNIKKYRLKCSLSLKTW